MLANCNYILIKWASGLEEDPFCEQKVCCHQTLATNLAYFDVRNACYVWRHLPPMSNKYTQIYPVCHERTFLWICDWFCFQFLKSFSNQESLRMKLFWPKQQSWRKCLPSTKIPCKRTAELMESPILRHTLGMVGWLILLILCSACQASSIDKTIAVWLNAMWETVLWRFLLGSYAPLRRG